MTDTPQLRERIAAIRAEFERTTRPEWRDVHPTGLLLAEIDRLNAELAHVNDALRAADIEHPLGAQGVRDLAAMANGRAEELATARAVGMREAAAMLRKYCPTHGAEDTCLMDCHCAGADEIDRDARDATPSAPTT